LVLEMAVISHYILINDFSLVSDYSVPVKQGRYIHNNAKPEEAVFISQDTTNDFYAVFFLSFLSDRNMRYAESTDDAMKSAARLNKAKGVFFELNPDTSYIKADHFITKENISSP
jgi:hypothetical protein